MTGHTEWLVRIPGSIFSRLSDHIDVMRNQFIVTSVGANGRAGHSDQCRRRQRIVSRATDDWWFVVVSDVEEYGVTDTRTQRKNQYLRRTDGQTFLKEEVIIKNLEQRTNREGKRQSVRHQICRPVVPNRVSQALTNLLWWANWFLTYLQRRCPTSPEMWITLRLSRGRD